MEKENETKYTEVIQDSDQVMTKGEKQMLESKKVINDIKKGIAGYQNDCETFEQSVKKFYSETEEDIKDPTKGIYKKGSALAKRFFKFGNSDVDPTKQQLGSLLESLVDRADGFREQLKEQVGDTEEVLTIADTMLDDLTDALTNCGRDRKQLKQEFGETRQVYNEIVNKYNAAIEAKDEDNIPTLFKDMTNAKREMETTKEDLLEKNAIYRSITNRAEFFSQYRDNISTSVSEGRKFHRQVKAETETLKPMYDALERIASLVEWQEKNLEIREVLRRVANAALVGTADMQKALATRTGEVMSEEFIDRTTIKALEAINKEAVRDIDQRDKELLEGVGETVNVSDLYKKQKLEDEDIIDLEETGKGSFSKKEEEESK